MLLVHQLVCERKILRFLNFKMERNTKRLFVSWLFEQIMFVTKNKSEQLCVTKKNALNDLTWRDKTSNDKSNWLPHNQCYIYNINISIRTGFLKSKTLPKIVVSKKSLFNFYYVNFVNIMKDEKNISSDKETVCKFQLVHLSIIVNFTVQNPICMLIIILFNDHSLDSFLPSWIFEIWRGKRCLFM